jgi:hypothetical protein
MRSYRSREFLGDRLHREAIGVAVEDVAEHRRDLRTAEAHR